MYYEPKPENVSSTYRTKIVEEALNIASEACGVSIRALSSRKRSQAKVAFARQMAMYLCHVVGRMSLRDVSAEFGRDRTTVGHACNTIEDRRDSPIFDKQVGFLESEMRNRVKSVESVCEGMSVLIERKSLVFLGDRARMRPEGSYRLTCNFANAFDHRRKAV